MEKLSISTFLTRRSHGDVDVYDLAPQIRTENPTVWTAGTSPEEPDGDDPTNRVTGTPNNGHTNTTTEVPDPNPCGPVQTQGSNPRSKLLSDLLSHLETSVTVSSK